MTDGRRRWTGAAARLAYLGVLGLATLASLRLDPDPAAVARRLRRMLSPTLSARDAVDAARNVVLFAGWGLVWVLTSPKTRAGRALGLAVVTGAAVSLSVELAQALSWTRRASALDVATNTLGALLGAAAAVLAARGVEARRGRKQFVGVPAVVFAGAYGAAVIGEALVPLFRQTPVRGAWGGPVRRWGVTAATFEWSSLATLPLGDLLLFLPAGILAVAALVEEGVRYRRAAAWTAVGGVATFAAAEWAHGVLGLPMVAGAALVHVVAVAAGAGLAAWLLPVFTRRWRGAARPRLLAPGYALVLLLWALRPYAPRSEPGQVLGALSGGWWVPLRALALRMDVFSVVDVVNGFMLYLPAGALLAVWPVRRRGPLAGVLPALYLAVVAELAQSLVAGRTVDVTDALIQAAGAAVGFVLTRRAGLRPYGELVPAHPDPRGPPGPVADP